MYRFGAELGGEYVAYGCEQQHVELLSQAEEVAEGQDDHLFGMSIQPVSHLQQNGLQGKHELPFRLQDSIIELTLKAHSTGGTNHVRFCGRV